MIVSDNGSSDLKKKKTARTMTFYNASKEDKHTQFKLEMYSRSHHFTQSHTPETIPGERERKEENIQNRKIQQQKKLDLFLAILRRNTK